MRDFSFSIIRHIYLCGVSPQKATALLSGEPELSQISVSAGEPLLAVSTAARLCRSSISRVVDRWLHWRPCRCSIWVPSESCQLRWILNYVLNRWTRIGPSAPHVTAGSCDFGVPESWRATCCAAQSPLPRKARQHQGLSTHIKAAWKPALISYNCFYNFY